MASRFKDLDVSVEDFISEQENESTKKKTLQNVAVLQQFLASKNEERKLEEIPPEELNEYLSEFIITVRTKDKQEEYEPSSLRGFIASFERYLKKKNYGHSIIKVRDLTVGQPFSDHNSINLFLSRSSQVYRRFQKGGLGTSTESPELHPLALCFS